MADDTPQIPASRVPLLEGERDIMSREWYRYFNNLQTAALTSNEANFNNVRRISFDTTPNPPVSFDPGVLSWDTSDETLALGMDYGVVQQMGLELFARVENQTGSTIPNGTVVGFAGVGAGGALAVAPYLANGSQPSLYILGVMAHTLPDSGQQGYCTVWGAVRDVDTTLFSAGDILYPSTTVAGGLTNIKPTAPNNVIPVAAVLTVATNGVIFVRPTIQQQQYYGVFSKTSDQSPAAINTEYLLTFDAAEISNGVSIGTPASRIQVVTSGLYQFAATIQLTSGSASAKTVWVWFKKNGVAVPDTARLVTVNINNGYTPLTLVDTLSLQAGDYVELAFAADDTAVTVDNIAATAFAPAAPAIVLTVQQAQQ
jgi:hypothetical protein